MISITFQGMTAREGLEHVNELVESGLKVNIDFEWAYNQEQFGESRHGKYCEFRFQDSTLATFYSLKWKTSRN
jgi:hypothetical protein